MADQLPPLGLFTERKTTRLLRVFDLRLPRQFDWLGDRFPPARDLQSATESLVQFRNNAAERVLCPKASFPFHQQAPSHPEAARAAVYFSPANCAAPVGIFVGSLLVCSAADRFLS